ncbi:hypothetical protein Aperf_G00000013839 [Anoplocephala perfoliata]
MTQPGSSTQYDENFPSLPSVANEHPILTPIIESYTPATVTEIIEIPTTEQRLKSKDISDEHISVCQNIAKTCGVKIDLTNCKNKSFSVVISGTPSNVGKAKLQVTQNLQMQSKRSIRVDQNSHRFLIGHLGQRKREIESRTSTKIYVPPPSRKSDEIIIEGPSKCLDAAEEEIRATIARYSQMVNEKLDIPKHFHAFICGPHNRTVNDISEKTGAKIAIPPSALPATEIVVSGKKKEVDEAVSQINEVVDSMKKTYSCIQIDVSRDKHRYVIGSRNEIFEQTGVLVEPPDSPDSDKLTVRGIAENIGKALSLVFRKASSIESVEVSAPHRLHRLLIGKGGTAVREITKDYSDVSVIFPKPGDQIKVEGPPEDVDVVANRLRERISELSNSHYLEVLEVDPKYHSKLLGNGPDSLIQYIRSNRLPVRMPSAADCGMPANERHIFLDGEKTSVEVAKAEVLKLVKKWDSEKVKDVIIEPRLQKILRAGNTPPIRQIEESFKEVEIRWPHDNIQRPRKGKPTGADTSSATDYIVQLCGIREQVDAAADKLTKLVKKLKDENHEQEVNIFRDCWDRIKGPTIINLLKETNTRIHYTPETNDSSIPAIIIGRQPDVEAAVARLEKLQRSLADIKEVTITLPTLMLSKQASNSVTPGARLRSIREQCEGVHLRTDPAHPRQLTISGPPEALDKAKALIDSICAKMLEHCTDSVVIADPKYHGQLIGRNGAALKRFRERHNVEVLFPDRLENDPKLASEIHVIGGKEAVAKAVADLQQTVKLMEDETEASVDCADNVLQDLWRYRNAFHYPELDRVKLVFPKSSNSPLTRRRTQATNGDEKAVSTIRIFGPKGCVEEAEQCLQKTIADIRSQTTVKRPVTELIHFQALSKLRPSIPDIQRNHNVLISLQLNRDGFTDEDSGNVIFGHIVLIGTPGRIDDALNNAIIPLLPVSEEVAFSREFYGKLFISEHTQQQQQRQRFQPNRRGQKAPQRGEKQDPKPTVTAGPADNDEAAPKSRLNALQSKFNVSITVPPRSQRNTEDQIVIRGPPDAVQECKKELEALEAKFKAEKADWEARNYEETLNVEERFLQRLISSQRDQALKHHDVAVFTRGRPIPTSQAPANPSAASTSAEEVAPEINGENPDARFNTTSDLNRFAGYRLTSTNIVPLVLQGYKEKVQLVRAEFEKLLDEFKTYRCEELVVDSTTHARLIGARRANIRRLEDFYNVEVEFPPRGAQGEAANIVLIVGPEDKLDDACEEIIRRANEIYDDLPKPVPHNGNMMVPQQPPSQNDFEHVGGPRENPVKN